VDYAAVQREIGRALSGVENTAERETDASGEQARKKAKTKTPTLDQLGIDITEKAQQDELDPSSGAKRKSGESSRFSVAGRRTPPS
jgi:ATP-dependent Clp protease ATP-binding subunit ClpC